MSETRFTKGPWERGTEDDDTPTSVFANGLLVATAHGPLDLPCFEPETDTEYDAAIEETEANADLVAAAPEMYEALDILQDILHFQHCGIPTIDDMYAKWGGMAKQVVKPLCHDRFDSLSLLASHLRNRALAKARGES